MVRAATWLSLALAGLLGVANAAEVANTEDTPDERAQRLCSENVPCDDGFFCQKGINMPAKWYGRCAPKFLSNAVCTADIQCSGGYCLGYHHGHQHGNQRGQNGGSYGFCACFSHDQCNNDMPGRKKYVCTAQNYCSPCKKKGCYPEFRFELGESCSKGNDCQSGKCSDNICSCSPAQPCEGGAKCERHGDCESTTCGDDGRCKCFNHKKRKVRVGCTDEQLCTKSNTCEALKLGGESCENNKECVGKCKKGVCQCTNKIPCQDDFYCEGKECWPQLDAEETCYDDIECKSGNCENYKCGCVAKEVKCPSGQYCLENGSEEVAGQGVCSEKKDWWQECNVPKECASGSCEDVGNKKRCKCQDDDDCPNTNRFMCDAGTCLVKDGEKCVVNDDPAKNLLSDGRNVRCKTGACVDGVCGKGLGGATCVGADGGADSRLCKASCVEDTSDKKEHVCGCSYGSIECADETQYCDSDHKCKQKVLGGEKCLLEDENADASVCQSDDCATGSSHKECSCDGPGNCKEGRYCPAAGGRCLWSKFEGVSGCKNMDLAYCKSGLCVDNTCKCTEHGHCETGFCSEDNTCKDKLVGGEECASDAQCESETCTEGVCECDPDSKIYCKDGQYCAGTVCKDDKFEGEDCGWGGQCLSGECDDTTNKCTCEVEEHCKEDGKICRTKYDKVCGAPLVYGSSCGSNEECASGLCNNDNTCGCKDDSSCEHLIGTTECRTTYESNILVKGVCV